MQVLRLETKNGKGIYRNSHSNIWDEITNSFEDPSIHIPPYLDLPLRFNEEQDRHLSFGFLNVEQYKQWCFNPCWRKKLGEKNVVLSIYEIDAKLVRKGKSQILFDKKFALLVKQLDPFFFN